METESVLAKLQHLLLQKEYNDLAKVCNELLQNARESRHLCLVYYYNALVLFKQQLYKEAIENYNICAGRLKIEAPKNKQIRAFVELELAFCYNNLDREQQAVKHATASLQMFESIQDNEGRCRSYLALGTASLIQSKIHDSLEHFAKGLEYTTENTKDAEARILLNISTCYSLNSAEDKVLHYAKNALDVINECEDINTSQERIEKEGLLLRTPLGYVRTLYTLTHIKSQCYGSISLILSNVGLFELATEYMNKGIEIAIATGNRLLIAHWKHNFSNTLLNLHMVNEARIHISDALSYLPDQGTDVFLPLIEFNQGRCCYIEQNYSSALNHFDSSMKMALAQQNARSIATTCHYLAKTHRKLGSLEKAQQYLNQAKQSAATMQDDYLHIMLQKEEAVHLMLSKNKQAIPLLQHVLERCKTLKYKTEEIETLEQLAEACSVFNQHKQAKEYYQELLRVQQETFTTRAQQQITTLSVLHRTETLQLEKQVLQERERNLEQERDHLQTQLTMKTNAMLEQLKAVNQLRTEVLDTLRDIDTAESILGKVKNKLNASTVLRQDWNSFSEVFDQVHPSFVKNLTQQFPNLTKMEVRICILLRTGMSTDDMAQLLFLSDRSIESHRLHLRKKLKLTRNDNLYTILSTL